MSTHDSSGAKLKNFKFVFVTGGPGSGKSTQCAKIVENFGFEHLSAGDLLRAEQNSGTEIGNMIKDLIKEGKLVPSEVTVKLILKAISESTNDKFLIDGFPRNEENREVWDRVTGLKPEFILFITGSEEEMERRVLSRTGVITVVNFFLFPSYINLPTFPMQNKNSPLALVYFQGFVGILNLQSLSIVQLSLKGLLVHIFSGYSC